jgi:hypothetical protein
MNLPADSVSSVAIVTSFAASSSAFFTLALLTNFSATAGAFAKTI